MVTDSSAALLCTQVAEENDKADNMAAPARQLQATLPGGCHHATDAVAGQPAASLIHIAIHVQGPHGWLTAPNSLRTWNNQGKACATLEKYQVALRRTTHAAHALPGCELPLLSALSCVAKPHAS